MIEREQSMAHELGPDIQGGKPWHETVAEMQAKGYRLVSRAEFEALRDSVERQGGPFTVEWVGSLAFKPQRHGNRHTRRRMARLVKGLEKQAKG